MPKITFRSAPLHEFLFGLLQYAVAVAVAIHISPYIGVFIAMVRFNLIRSSR